MIGPQNEISMNTNIKNSTAIAIVFLLLTSLVGSNTFEGLDGRYCFSLTTFDSTGKLRQVEYASKSANTGRVFVAAKIVGYDPSLDSRKEDEPTDNSALIAVSHRQVSPLIRESGTASFIHIHPQALLTCIGICADARTLVKDIIRSIIEFEYTYDEVIPLERLLADVSRLMQQNTMMAGVRPYGCSILLTFLPEIHSTSKSTLSPRQKKEMEPQFYLVGPSGAVTTLEGSLIATDMKSIEVGTEIPRSLKDVSLHVPSWKSKHKIAAYRGHQLQSKRSTLSARFSQSRGLQVQTEFGPNGIK